MFSFKQIYEWLSEIINGIDFLHKIRIIHRDIKPENILIKNKHLLLTDFGASAQLGTYTNEKATQTGTSKYWSPEIDDGKKYDFKTDIWSAGCVLFELITLKIFKIELNNDESIDYQIPKSLKNLLKM